MNFDQYFTTRADLIARVLLDGSGERLFAADWRFFGAGLGCIAAAVSLHFWASLSQSDPGYFARTSTFLLFVLLAGVLLLAITLAADYLLARVAVEARETVKEKALRQLLRIDGALARNLAERADSTYSTR